MLCGRFLQHHLVQETSESVKTICTTSLSSPSCLQCATPRSSQPIIPLEDGVHGHRACQQPAVGLVWCRSVVKHVRSTCLSWDVMIWRGCGTSAVRSWDADPTGTPNERQGTASGTRIPSKYAENSCLKVIVSAR
jgi:hypothetical protein